MDKRIYYAPRKFKILADGNYNGYHYYVTSLGTHPCCYIEIPNGHRFYGLSQEEAYDIIIGCHGGITFGGEIKGIDGYVIGWDYAHYGDFNYYEVTYPQGEETIVYTPTPDEYERAYTFKELVHDCFEAIDDLVEIDREYIIERNKEWMEE